MSATARIARAEDNRVDHYDWGQTTADLGGFGCAVMENLLSPAECEAVAALCADEGHFRSHVVMARHGFGKGEYRYFSYPLPGLIQELRTALYARLAPVANDWNARMGDSVRYPAEHRDYLELCHNAGQLRPAPLLLQYVAGEFVLTEQRPRMQSRVEVVPLCQGDAVAFAVHNRPVTGTRGNYRVNLRHGVSRIRSGRRHTLGLIFHDAK